MEFWKAGRPVVGEPPDACALEAAGWDGLRVMDSQCLSMDPYVLLGLLAQQTSHLKLATGVTNPCSRHPAVTANAAMSAHVLSGGRAVLGIARGDSALAYLGLAPTPLEKFELSLATIRALLEGRKVEVEPEPGPWPSVSTIPLGRTPEAAALKWVPEDIGRPPIDVAASGPRAIAVAARHADQITFAVGSEPRRVEWAVAIAREAREQAELDPDTLSFGVWVNMVVHPDIEAARRVVEQSVGTVARFSVMHGAVQGPTSIRDANVYEGITRHYDMTRHSGQGRLPPDVVTPSFIENFAIVGRPDICLERIANLKALGVERIVAIDASAGAPETFRAEAEELFVQEVMPVFR